jgi:acyl-CoA thioester hydrolase
MSMAVFVHTIRVRYAESDQMGVAHHGAYVSWLEECRIEMMRSLGSSYRHLEEAGVLMPVVELTMRYRSSLRFDDVARFSTTAAIKGPSRLAFHTQVHLEERLCAEGTVVVAATGRDGRPIRIPADLVQRLGAPAATGQSV